MRSGLGTIAIAVVVLAFLLQPLAGFSASEPNPTVKITTVLPVDTTVTPNKAYMCLSGTNSIIESVFELDLKDKPKKRIECVLSGPSNVWALSSANDAVKLLSTNDATTTLSVSNVASACGDYNLHVKVTWDERKITNWVSPPGESPRGEISCATNLIISIIKVDIKKDGVVITDKIIDVMAGEKINLAGEVNPSSGLSSKQWTIQNADEVISDWNVDVGPSKKAWQAHVVPIGALDQSTVSFYWIAGSFAGDTREVKYKVSIAGVDFESHTTFKVHRPKSQVSITHDKVYLKDPKYTRPGTWIHYGFAGDNLTLDPKGVDFTATIQVPAGFTARPNLDEDYFDSRVIDGALWVQLGQFNRTWKDETDGKRYEWKSAGYYLDEQMPYCGGLNFCDSPAQKVDGAAWFNINDESFKTWLMWFPSGVDSIPIPLQVIEWSWLAIAHKNDLGVWTLDSSNSPEPTHSGTTQYPEWTWSTHDVKNVVIQGN